MLRLLINLAIAAPLILAATGDQTALSRLPELVALVEPLQPEPEAAVRSGPGSLTVDADRRGHFVVNAVVDGQPVRFLVDSGASHVVLSQQDARRLKLSVSERTLTEIYSTPAGMMRAAPVRLAEIRIGGLQVRNVRASISERPMDISLLGSSFLGRLASYEVSQGRMTLRW